MLLILFNPAGGVVEVPSTITDEVGFVYTKNDETDFAYTQEDDTDF